MEEGINVKIKNISNEKIRVGPYRLCAGHILDIKDGTDVSSYVAKGEIEIIEQEEKKNEKHEPKERTGSGRPTKDEQGGASGEKATGNKDLRDENKSAKQGVSFQAGRSEQRSES